MRGRPAWVGYVWALVFVGLAVGLRFAIQYAIGPRVPFILFFPALVAAATMGGVGPGVVALLLSAGASLYFLPPVGTISIGGRENLLVEALFLLTGGVIVWVCGAFRHARRTAEIAAARQRRADERLQAVLASIDDHLVSYDREWRFTFVNEGAERILGKRKEELLGRSIWDVFPDAVGNAYYHALHQARDERRVVRFEHYYPTHGRWYDNYIYPTTDGVTVFATDVTEQRRVADDLNKSREALRESEARLRLALDAGNVGAWEWDIPTNRVTWSERIHQFHGLQPGEFDGTVEGFSKLVHPDDADSVGHAIRDALETGSEYQVEFRTRWPDGQVRWLATRARVVRDSFSGAPLRMIGTTIDVTDRRRSENALRESEERFRTLANLGPQLTWVSDAGGNILQFNARWEEYIGEAPDAVHGGVGWVQMLHPDDRERVHRIRSAAIAAGQPYEVEERICRRDGEYRWHLARIVPIKSPDGRVTGWIGSATDVHDLKTAHEEVEQARAVAEHANRAKDQFLAVLSHELRTPLTPVLLSVQLLERDPKLPESVRDRLELIRRNIGLETRLIDDLLDISRIVNGKLALQLQDVRVHPLIHQVVEMVSADVAAKRLRVVMGTEAADDRVRADPTRLHQVLWNVLKNAIKFSHEDGTIEVKTRTELWSSSSSSSAANDWDGKGASSLSVSIRDTGVGIEPDILPRIFAAFDQGESGTTRRFGGLGLGLAISRAIVEMHGGRIVAESAGRDRGATFTIELPCATGAGGRPKPGEDHDWRPPPQFSLPPPPRRNKVAAPSDGAPHADGDGAVLPAPQSFDRPTRRRVLVVDDHPDTLEMMTVLLESLGYDVCTAGCVEEAAARAADGGPFHLLMSDVGLPDGSGVDVIARVRAACGAVPAIAMTGFGMDEDVRRTRAAGFAAHLVKPIDVSNLSQTLDAVLAGCTTAPAPSR